MLYKYFNFNNTKLVKLKNIHNILYLGVIVFCLLANFIYYRSLTNSRLKEDDHELNKYAHNIGSVINDDFKKVLEKKEGDFLFFKYFGSSGDASSGKKEVYFNNDNIYVVNNNKVFVFRQEKFKGFLKNILPPYICYQVLFNKVSTAQHNASKTNLVIKNEYQINNNTSIIISLGIDYNESLYFGKILKLYLKVLSALIISLTFTITVIYLYLRKQQQISLRFKNLEDTLTETDRELKSTKSTLETFISALLQEKKAERALRRLFIKNATAIYLDNNIPNMSPEQKRVNELSNFLFPIAFTEPANDEEIKVHEVIKDLTDYTAFEATKYDISFDKQVETLKVQCSKTVFYQILFSLVSNLIHLMPAVSGTPLPGETKKKFTVTFLAEKIIIDYETFPLSADNIGGFLRKKGTDVVDAFFLDYRRILESLKTHKIDYTMNTNPTGNRFELDFKKKIPKGKPNLRLVE